MNSECKNYPMKEFRAKFFNFIDFSHQVRICETKSFLNISCISKWALQKFGLQIWIQNAKIILWKNFGAIFPILSILVIRSAYVKQGHFSILAVFQNGLYRNLGCRFEFITQKLPCKRILGNFSNVIDFSHQVRVCETISFLHVSCISKYMGVADLNSERKFYTMKEFLTIFLISSILVIRTAYAKQGHFSILAVFQNVWDLHKFGLQNWIQNAKFILWKNFGQFFRFHWFPLSGPHMRS